MKRIRLKKYDMTFIYIPVLLLSILSVITYIIRLFNSEVSDYIFFTGTVVLLCFFIVSKVNLKALKVIMILLAIVFLAAFYILGNSFLITAAKKLSSSAVSFGFFDFLFNTCSVYKFQQLVYETSCGGARIIDNQIICGVINIVKANPDSELISYLSGKVVFMFALCGILLSEKKNFKANLLVCALMLISGNPSPALILLLFTSPSIYFLAMLINFFSFIISAQFDIKGAFRVNPSLFEVFYHSDNIINLLAFSVLLCAVSYFVSRLVNERKR